MKIYRGANLVAQVDLRSGSIESTDMQLEEFFYELVDEGLPAMRSSEIEGELIDVEIYIPLGIDTEGLFIETLEKYGYEARV